MKESHLQHTKDGAFTRLIQECSEVSIEAMKLVVTLTKIQQYGDVATDFDTDITYDNVHDLLSEMNDLEHAMVAIRDYYAKKGIVVPMPDIPIVVIP